MWNYCLEKEEDREELLPFICDIFQEDFTKTMKKVYGDGAAGAVVHHLVKEDGKIVAAVGIYEQEYQIGEASMKTGYIGSVSVAKEKRGCGYMKLLMQKAEEDMKQRGFVLSMLGGKRNRYAFYGYEIGGLTWEFHFEEENIRHTIGWKTDPSVELLLVEPTDTSALNELYKLYCRNEIRCRSREEFFDCCTTWENKLFQIQIEGNFAGYLLSDAAFNSIPELMLEDYKQLLHVMKTYLLRKEKKSCIVYAQAWEIEKLTALLKSCEFYKIKPACNLRILDYKAFFAGMLTLQGRIKKLEEGQLIIQVIGQGTYQLSILNGITEVRELETQTNAELVLTEKDVINALFSPAAGIYETAGEKKYPFGWFPFLFSPRNVDEF